MKKTFIAIALTSTIIGGTMFTGCKSSPAKVEAAQENVDQAKQELKEAQRTATAEEWKEFKDETDARINANESSITEFKLKMKKSGRKLDAIYEEKIERLEQQNRDLKMRVEGYEYRTQSNWDSFKREFNHDMDELGIALKDLTVDNKK